MYGNLWDDSSGPTSYYSPQSHTANTSALANSFTPQYVSYKGCSHEAKAPVKIGGYDVWLAAHQGLDWEVTKEMDVILPLNGSLPKSPYGVYLPIIHCTLQDYGGVPKNWLTFITNIAELIKSGKKVVAYCIGSHGRTGCFAASLIALLEPDIEDPVAEIRARHCSHAVESAAQIEAIFAIKGVPVPEKYKSFKHTATYGYSGKSSSFIFNPYKITKIEERAGVRINWVESHFNDKEADRIFFVSAASSKYEIGNIVRLKEE